MKRTIGNKLVLSSQTTVKKCHGQPPAANFTITHNDRPVFADGYNNINGQQAMGY